MVESGLNVWVSDKCQVPTCGKLVVSPIPKLAKVCTALRENGCP